MRFDLTDLRLFVAVVDAGSITHGAAEAGLSLAAASERLRDMETDGAVRLLDRGRRGVLPTEAGEALANHARLILRQVSQMRDEVGEHARGLRSTIRLVANTAAIAEFLPERLAPWLANNPRIDIDIKERTSPEIARAVTAGQAEIGILSDAVETSGLRLLPFAIDRLVVVARHDHPLLKASRVTLADIVGEYFVGLTEGALQRHIEAHAAALGRRLKMRLRLRSFDGICRVAGKGAALGIVPETAARRCGRAAGCGFVPLDDDWATRQLSVCVRAEGRLTPPVRSVLEHLATPHG